MRRLARSTSGANRIASVKTMLISACLSASFVATAQSPAASADHRYYVTRCIEQAAAAAKDKAVSPETYRAQCEALESAIDAGLGRSAPLYAVSKISACDTQGVKIGCTAMGEPLGANSNPAGPGADGRPRLAKLMDQAKLGPPPLLTDCKEIGCAGRYWFGDGYGYGYGYGYPYDEVGALHRSQIGGVSNTDYLSDMLIPGFGRFEQRRKDDTYFRIDFINPRRCGRERVGICLSLTMH